MKKKIASLILAATMLTCAACTAKPDDTKATEESAASSAEASAIETSMPDISTDRAGNAIEVPENIDKIVSLAPSTTEVLIELGLADKIVGIDYYSADYLEYLDADIPHITFIIHLSGGTAVKMLLYLGYYG